MGVCRPCDNLVEVEDFNPKDFNPRLHSIRCPKCGGKMIPHTADKVITYHDIDNTAYDVKKRKIEFGRLYTCLDDMV